jgi:Ca-activated chloride channel homolog
MKINLDDPRLTAYALGELDEAARAGVEQMLAETPEARQAVEEIRQMADLMTRRLQEDPQSVSLTAAQRTAIDSSLEAHEHIQVVSPPRSHDEERWPSWRQLVLYGGLAVAACFALLLSVAEFRPRAREAVGPRVLTDESHLTAPDARPTSPAESQSTSESMRGLNSAKSAAPQLNSPPASESKPVQAPVGTSGKELLRDQVAEPSKTSEAFIEKPQPSVSQRVEVEAAPSIPSEKKAKSMDQLSVASEAQRLLRTQPQSAPAQPADRGMRLGGAATSATPETQERLKAAKNIDGFIQDLGDLQSEEKPSVREYSRMDPAVRRYGLAPSRPGTVPEHQIESLAEESRSFRMDPRSTSRYRIEPPASRSDADRRPLGTAVYPQYVENTFLPPLQNPLSTFSIDVDTASYANVRRFLNQGQLPPRDAVRIEELINYFSYRYPEPKPGEPFAADIEVADCPWNPEHRLIRVALKARDITATGRPAANFVFLIDVSGSMQPRERLPLIKQGLRSFVKKLTPRDRVALVVYASQSGLALASTSAEEKETILSAIDRLEAGGSTNGGQGIQQAYAVASEHFIQGGVNRVILCTDGDFNVGITDQGDLIKLIREKAQSGVFLSALGVGTDNYKDALMQNLADKGNGNYHYIDTFEEAQKVLIDEMNATLVTVAKDVKVQIEFNPAAVSMYRLIGYEKRLLRNQDFDNDKKDAGEIGAGQTVTVLYEAVPAGAEAPLRVADNLKYQPALTRERRIRVPRSEAPELLTLKLRYKKPESDQSQLLEFVARDVGTAYRQASGDFKFASAVASFGMLLKGSEHKGAATYDSTLELAQDGKGADEQGLRAEFLNLVRRAKELEGRGR